MEYPKIIYRFMNVRFGTKVLIALLFSFSGINHVSATNAELEQEAIRKLEKIHATLRLKYGNKNEEYPEQLMTALYLPSDAKVLELGSDVGRNSCVIGKILKDSRNLVTMEPRREAIYYLNKNRKHNHLNFHIENAAISKIPLIQKGWITTPSEKLLPGYESVETVTFNDIQNKYNIKFDTLVIDCEGAFYYILRDEPNILENIKLVIIENDFACKEHYEYVANAFCENGFELVYDKLTPYWGENAGFYQVWKLQE